MRTKLGMMLLAGGVALSGPAPAQNLGDAISGIATTLLQQEMDRNAFAEAQRVNSVSAYRNYLSQFPRGIHRADAERAMQKLGGTDTRPAPAQGDRAAFAEAERRNTVAAYRDYIARYPNGQFRADADLAISQLTGQGGDQTTDRTAFAEAQRRNTVAAYRDYLSRYPNGIFRADAELAISQLSGTGTPSVDTPAYVESQLGLTKARRQTLQSELTRLGYDTRGADGSWGRNTRSAISAWQKANNLGATGYVTSAQVRLISAQAAQLPMAPAPKPTPTPTPAPTSPPSSAIEAERLEKAIGLSIAERREIQLRLTLLGHDTQGTDGDFGAATRRAIRDWQRSQGDPSTGYVTSDQFKALQRQTRG